MIPTPETDTETFNVYAEYDGRKKMMDGDLVEAEFARKLERELNESRQKLAILQDLLNDLEDPLQLIAEYWDKNETLESMTGACWHAVGTAEKALEKIRPHLTWYNGKEAVS